MVNVPLTVSRIRSQRSGCVQVSAQYLFVYRALIDFALSRGLVPPELEASAAAAVCKLSGPSPQLAHLPMSTAPVSLPTDTNLLSILTSSLGSGGSFPSSTIDPVHFSALMRILRCHMTKYEVLILPKKFLLLQSSGATFKYTWRLSIPTLFPLIMPL